MLYPLSYEGLGYLGRLPACVRPLMLRETPTGSRGDRPNGSSTEVEP
jgi:hypothetical protein